MSFSPTPALLNSLLWDDGGSTIINGSVASVKGTPAFGVCGATKAAPPKRTWAADWKHVERCLFAVAVDNAYKGLLREEEKESGPAAAVALFEKTDSLVFGIEDRTDLRFRARARCASW